LVLAGVLGTSDVDTDRVSYNIFIVARKQRLSTFL